MKVEAKLFALLGVFFLVMALIYGYFSHGDEPVGVVGFILSFGFSMLIAFFLWYTGRKTGLRPDDNPDALISDVEGDYGFFSPHSWWPLFLGIAGAIVFLGLAVGWWMVIIGVPFLALASVGFVMEYFRGEDAI